MRIPIAGVLDARTCAMTVALSITRSTNTSTRPPVSFTPKKRAFTTRVSLKTSTSPASSVANTSVNSPSISRSDWTCKRRDCVRSAKGDCAISSAGRLKSKSVSEYIEIRSTINVRKAAADKQKPVFYAALANSARHARY